MPHPAFNKLSLHLARGQALSSRGLNRRSSCRFFGRYGRPKATIHHVVSPDKPPDTTPVPDTVAEKLVSYAGSQVWRSPLRHKSHHKLLEKLVENNDISIWQWKHDQVEYLVTPEKGLAVKYALEDSNLGFEIFLDDVQEQIEMTRTAQHMGRQRCDRLKDFKEYPNLECIEEFTKTLTTKYANRCKSAVIGNTAENRAITMFVITDGKSSNPGMLITGGIHAREWAAITSAYYTLNKLCSEFDKQPQYVRNKNWYVIPLVNMDGYAYTITTDRLWRKNRRKVGKGCVGVDINRNFDIHDSKRKNVNNCSSTSYPGSSAFSELETSAIRDAVKQLPKFPSAYVDVHSYGQYILHPWSIDTNLPNKYKLDLGRTGTEMAQVIKNTSHSNYTVGHTHKLLYPVAGAAVDWFYDRGSRFSYVVEVRDKGNKGFLLPPQYIKPTGEELYEAIKVLASKVTQ